MNFSNIKGENIKKNISENEKGRNSFQTHNTAPRDLVVLLFVFFVSIGLILKFRLFDNFYDFSLKYNHLPGAVALSAIILSAGLIIFTVRRGKEMFSDLNHWEDMKFHLQKEKEWSELIIDNAPNLIMGLDQNTGIILFNKFAQQLTGYSFEKVSGETYISNLVPNQYQNDTWKFWNEMIEKKLDFSSSTGYLQTKNGEIRTILWNHKPLLLEDKFKMILCIGEDVTEKQITDLKIQKSLIEKEVLLKEVHHRVKNNLQIIVSMLNMQINQISEEKLRSMLRISQSRIRTIAMIHEALYNSSDMINIGYDLYLRQFMRYLIQTYLLPKSKIDIQTHCENLFLDINLAIPCSLILNELVSNSLKHAFPDNRPGKVTVKMAKIDDIYHLIVEDNGIGLPDDFEIDKLKSLGLILVRTLTTQLKGKLSYDCTDGCRFEIQFKDVRLKAHNEV